MQRLIRQRKDQILAGSDLERQTRQDNLISQLAQGPVAELTHKANQQHYEVPAEFFRRSLGPRLKYSCCYWPPDVTTLEEAEVAALKETCRTADLQNGHTILELGCGWGSLSLWMAEQFPDSRIVAVSNSHSQKTFIDQQAAERGLGNLTVQTCDINDFQPQETFDRVVSVEMFEHVRNHSELMRRIESWLTSDGRLFVHIFCHASAAYLFEDEDSSSWMAREFFSGGIMPSADLLIDCQLFLELEQRVIWNGKHYERTSNAWLDLMDQQSDAVAEIFRNTYGAHWKQWRQRWRMFYMACAELFGFDNGDQWFVTHYRFKKRQSTSGASHG
jgi:cyclopropane-fatty-acyl-phospholipid synthase